MMNTEYTIKRESIVGQVLDDYPWLLDTFVSFGFKPLQNPILRKTIAKSTTIKDACERLGVEAEALLEALNESAKAHQGETEDSDVLDNNEREA